MIYLRLFWEFCKVGLFSVGGGLATIPFLTDLGERTGWFTSGQLADMIAISESTPGPMGVNMATYVGFASGRANCGALGEILGGILGGVTATLGLVFPSVIIILVISKFLQKFRQSKIVDGVFYGLRAASVALITAAMLQVAKIALMVSEPAAGAPVYNLFSWPAIILAVVVFVLVKWSPAKKLHPICFIALSAAAGIILQM